MTSTPQILDERVRRLTTAIALEKPDRVSVVISSDAFCTKHMGFKLADYISNTTRSSEIIARSLVELGDVDASEYMVTSAPILGAAWLSKVKLPGRELGEDEPWQVEEVGYMSPEDYDTIISKGYNYFFQDFLKNRLPVSGADMTRFLATDFHKAAINLISAGILPLAPVTTLHPFDIFCGGRGMMPFTRDLFKIPDKLQVALEVTMTEMMEMLRHQIRSVKPFAVFYGVGRAASEFLSPKMWQRFVFPYIKQTVETIVGEGSFAFLHFDSNWERDLEYFRDLPKGKCIFASDHATSVYKLKEKLGDHMCIMGDVPAALLTLGTTDEVYNYCTKLISDIGPSGYIMGPACILPSTAKVENVKAMIAAATGK